MSKNTKIKRANTTKGDFINTIIQHGWSIVIVLLITLGTLLSLYLVAAVLFSPNIRR